MRKEQRPLEATKSSLGEYKDLPKELKNAILMSHYYAEMGDRKRSASETQDMLGYQRKIVECAENIIEDLCDREIKEIAGELEQYERWDNGGVVLHLKLLDDVLQKNHVPSLEDGFVNVDNINRVLSELYVAQANVSQKVEELRPILYRWQHYEKKMESVIKGLVDFSTEWKADTVVAAFMVPGVYDKIRMLESYVERFTIRKASLDKAFEIVSRMMTLHIDAPAGEFSRALPPDALESLEGVHKHDRRKQGPESLARTGTRPVKFGKKRK